MHDQEMLTIIKSMNHWRHYLKEVQHQINVINDHANLQHFMITTKFFCKQMKWINKLTAYNFKIIYQKEVSNFADNSLRKSDYKKDFNADERKFTHDLIYIWEHLKSEFIATSTDFLTQSASMLIIFTWQIKILIVKNHEKIVIKSFKKIINLFAFAKRVREVSQILRKFLTDDEKAL